MSVHYCKIYTSVLNKLLMLSYLTLNPALGFHNLFSYFRALLTFMVLTVHEAMPGHHLQVNTDTFLIRIKQIEYELKRYVFNCCISVT